MKNLYVFILTMIAASFLAGCGESSNESSSSSANTQSESAPASAPKVDPATLYAQAVKLRESGGPSEKQKEFELFSQAADAGYGDAMFFLGVIYESGETGSVDLEKALSWYEKSAQAGTGPAVAKAKELKAKLAKQKK